MRRFYPLSAATRFELIVNLQSAKALNLVIPTSILLRADEVIEIRIICWYALVCSWPFSTLAAT